MTRGDDEAKRAERAKRANPPGNAPRPGSPGDARNDRDRSSRDDRKGWGACRWTVVGLLTLCTLMLGAITVLAGLIFLNLRTLDLGGLKEAIAGVQKETGAMHADMGKSLTGLQKSLSDTADKVNSATIQLNDIALSLHKKP